MTLSEQIQRICGSLAAGQYVNEASVCQGIVLPILQDLGWPVFDPLVVSPEFTVEGRRVDYALCHPPTKPAVFIEVKQQGRSEGADRQLFEYAFHLGVPLAVLTDGREWHFYLPAGQGHYQERRVYRLDVIDRQPEESAKRLTRYLSYAAVSSGKALRAATEDYEGVRRDREIAATIPVAWHKLLEDQDTLLTELLADQVETLCGFKPDLDSVAQFIANQLSSQQGIAPTTDSGQQRTPRRAAPQALSEIPTYPRTSAGTAKAGFTLHGKRTPTRSAIDTLIQFLLELAKRDESFLDRFAALPQHGRRRRFVARSPAELYPDREDLARDYTYKLMPGWYVGTNYGSSQIEQIMQMAAKVAGLEVGKEVAFHLPRRDRAV